MKRKLSFIGICSLLSFLCVALPGSAADNPYQDVKLSLETATDISKASLVPAIVISYPSKTLVIDGKLDKKEYKPSQAINNFHAIVKNTAPFPSTQAWLSVDNDNLYVAFRCTQSAEQTLKSQETQHDGAVLKDDSVELFIWPSNANKRVYRFASNASGTQLDEQINLSDGSVDKAWNPEWIVKKGQEQDAWTLEMSIPLTSLNITPLDVKGIRLNLVRNLTGNSTTSVYWSPTKITPQDFGVGALVFSSKVGSFYGLYDMKGLPLDGLLRVVCPTPKVTSPDPVELLADIRLPEIYFMGIDAVPELKLIPVSEDGQDGTPVSLGSVFPQSPSPYRLTISNLPCGNYKLLLEMQNSAISFSQKFDIAVQKAAPKE